MHILLVEDVPSIAAVTSALAEAVGHRVMHAADGIEAVALAIAHDFDLVLMDIEMPGIDGIEATQRIRRLPGTSASVPIVALSALFAGNVDEALVSRCRAAGFTEFLAKPMTLGHLHMLDAFVHPGSSLPRTAPSPQPPPPSRTAGAGRAVAPTWQWRNVAGAMLAGGSGRTTIPASAAAPEALQMVLAAQGCGL